MKCCKVKAESKVMLSCLLCLLWASMMFFWRFKHLVLGERLMAFLNEDHTEAMYTMIEQELRFHKN